jgi:hypothetical protein
MTNWLRELNLCPEYEETDSDSSKSIQDLSLIIAERLKSIKRFPGTGEILRVNQQRDQLILNFLALAKNPLATVEDFNQQMVGLFDWGDIFVKDDTRIIGKVCWIKTFDVNEHQ